MQPFADIDLLDFPVVYDNSLQISKTISPYLFSNYGLVPPNLYHLSFLYSSIPLYLKRGFVNYNSHGLYKSPEDDSDLTQPTLSPKQLAYTRLFSDTSLESLIVYESKCLNVSYSAFMSNEDEVYNLNALRVFQLDNSGNTRYSAEMSLSSLSRLIGLKGLFKHSSLDGHRYECGGELYFSAAETSGGLSLGGLYGFKQGEFCFLLNPIMGHVSLSYFTCTLLKHLKMAARYDINMYSFDSDLGVGLFYAVYDRMLKFRISSQSIGIQLESYFNSFLIAVGVSVDKRSSSGIGIELQYSR